ncbi:MAG: TGS domain-containing protein [Candidatus Bathyarchaeota archaeon]|nr:TGS domain-containing protein [Candidatus Bathyarchaeota archaeon]
MPTNLPPEAKDKWAEVEAARHPKEKLQKMQEFLSCVPQHKGTLKLRGQIKKKMAVLRKEMEEKKQKRAARGGPKFFIEKEGAAQVALLGVTKAGKSCLLSAVTNANVLVSTAPYATREPVPAVMNFEDVQFQIVEAPALMEGSADGRAWGLQTLAVARNADGLILMVDLSENPIAQLELILSELEKARVLVSKPKGRVDIDRRYAGASLRIILVGKLVDCTMREVEALLRSYRITDAIVKISGEVTLDDVEDAIFESTTYRPAVIVANKLDLTCADANLRLLETYVDGKIPIVAVSCEKKLGLEKLGSSLFKALGIIRVYTKEPSARDFSKKPFTLKKNATLHDLAKSIHTDFERDFAFAKVWSKRLAFSPQKVGLGFVLEDGDVVEIHVR